MNEIEFEKIFMNRIVKDKDYLSRVFSCNPMDEVSKYPIREENQLLLEKVLSYFAKTMQIPTIEILRVDCDENEVQMVETAWRVANETNGAMDKSELMSLTEKYLQSRALQYVIEQSSRGRISGSEVVEKANKAVGITLDQNVGYNIVDGIDSFCSKLTAVNSTITTGYEWLDKQLGGGWIVGEPALYVFAGETNVGKSVFLMQFATAAYKAGKNVLIVSLEMSEFMYAKRIYSNITQIGINDLQFQSENLRQMISSPNPSYGKLIVKEFPTGTLTIPQLETYLDDLSRNGFNPDVIFVDYLNLMTTNKSDGKKYEEIGKLAVGLRKLSYSRAPVVTATQLNRSGMGKANPGIDKTADSVEASFCADFQASIFQLPEQRELGTISIGIQKTRFGDKGGVKLFSADFPHMTIREMDASTEGIVAPTATVTTATDDFDSMF